MGIGKLFDNNRDWVEETERKEPGFFETLRNQQSPEYLWIGCSDSRVPANEIVGLMPGELFVHRNVANLVVQTDFNCLSVMEYAVHQLKVKHIIVCGHYGCGGVRAALTGERSGRLADNWLRHLREVYLRQTNRFEELTTEQERWDLLCELNVNEQVRNVSYSTVIQDAWRAGQELSVHGVIYNVADGILRDLNVSQTGEEALATV